MRNHKLATLALVLTILAPICSQADDAFSEREFTLNVLPLLTAKCFACHGDDQDDIKGALDLTSREGLLTGGESGEPAIVVGDASASMLYQAVMWDGIEMPPKENDRLSAEQIELVHRWIDAGAPWPNAATQAEHRAWERTLETTDEGVIVHTSGGTSEDWTYRRYQPEDLWAFQPVQRIEVPAGVQPVDHFIEQRLHDAEFEPTPEADPRTLIRRATFDLIGLPPTPDEVDQFLTAWDHDAEQAWSDLVDRLLDSPQYGERWAQHWLDVARYSDTGGMANDFERSNMWRYRDYVIRSFNSDKPYNRFIVEQLAGDQLADASVRDRLNDDEHGMAEIRANGHYTAEEAEWIVATGFLRMGPWDNAMIMAPQARQIYLDDLVNSVGQTFLATTLRCVKCHDHKFDPIPTRDYYSFYAAFAGTQMAERPLVYLPEESRERFDDGRAFVESMLAFATSERERIEAKQEAAARAWFEERGLEYVPPQARQDLPDDQKPPRHVGLDYAEQGELKVREQDEWIWTRALERYEPMVQSVYDGPDVNYAWNGARKLRMPENINLGWRPDSHILTGGALEAPGDAVLPGVLSAVTVPVSGSTDEPWRLPEELDSRRLALAEWIADERNPLTTRAIVNRVWQYHFGKPLVATPNNFGVNGSKPTHPELLDWLASDFVTRGWSIKQLHRTIMLSHTYRQANQHARYDELQTIDPNNDLFAYFPTRRLSAEELRDAMLCITDELNPELGGLPVMPEINLEVALQPRMIQFSLAPAYQPSRTPEERNRRSIYAYRVRGQADPFLEVFNQPIPNDSCEIRDSAAVSPQAFTLMNSDLMTDRSIAFALRLGREAASLDNQVARAFQLALCREPQPYEVDRLREYVAEMQTYHRDVQPTAVTYPTRITRSLVEEFTGMPFEYEEILPVFEDYVADAKPADVSPETRALADLCLLLFNSNEFLFVY